jgi:LCP family protein required for cell wall assembly
MPQDPDDPKKGWEGDYRIYRSGSDGSGAGRGRASTHAARSKQPAEAEPEVPAGNRSGSGSGGDRGGSRPSGGSSRADGGPRAPGDRDAPPRAGGSASGGGGRSGSGRGPGSRASGDPPPYNLYRSQPRGLIARLRGESDADIGQRVSDRERVRQRPLAVPGGRWRWQWSWRRGLAGVVLAIVGWVLLSLILFVISAQQHAGNLPAGAQSELTGGAPMLFSPNTVLVVGLDNRPKTGPGSKEPGSNYSQRHARTDTIMLWRIGGGVSRRLSIPRDTLVDIPGYGNNKINAAWAYGGPRLALKTVKQFTGLKINHLIVVDLANFPKFIDDIGGVTVKTGRICSNISGGAVNGGFTLNLRPGTHHLSGLQALTLARTRENSCNLAYTDLNREAAQQQILNGIKSQLFTFHTFFNLPWVAWDAPGVIETDMGSLSLLQLFLASEIGGSAPTHLLKETPSYYNGQSVLVPNSANLRTQVRRLLDG